MLRWHRWLCRKIPKTLSGIETSKCRDAESDYCCRKIPKTLSGIETQVIDACLKYGYCRKIPKTLSGIETSGNRALSAPFRNAGKYLKPYQGLKHKNRSTLAAQARSRKIPKTLSGIETQLWLAEVVELMAGKYLKPYQGLKRPLYNSSDLGRSRAGKYLKPYQGLKPGTFRDKEVEPSQPENT